MRLRMRLLKEAATHQYNLYCALLKKFISVSVMFCIGLTALCYFGSSQVISPVQARRIALPQIDPIQIRIASGIQQPVVLQTVNINTEITGQLAETTVDMIFFNPNNRVLEGQLEFPLLESQRISGFALEMEDGKLRQAVPVEKAKGREAFDDVTRQKIDPALLEKTQGNNYQIRVYPLNPQRTRRVQLRYQEVLPRQGQNLTYRLPLAYGSNLNELNLSMQITGARSTPVISSGPVKAFQFSAEKGKYQAKQTEKSFSGSGMLTVAIPASNNINSSIEQKNGQTYFYTEVPLAALGIPSNTQRKTPGSIGLLWDSSASGNQRNHQREFALLDAYFNSIQNVNVMLQQIRDTADKPKTFKVTNGNWQALRAELEKAVYDGATNLGAFNTSANVDEYLLFSDGLDNYSLKAFVSPKKPLYTILSSAKADPERLRALAEQSGGKLIDLNNTEVAQAVKQLQTNNVRLAGMSANGAKSLVAPSRLVDNNGLKVAGILTEQQTQLILNLSLPNGQQKTVTVPLHKNAPRTTLAAAEWARLRITELNTDYQRNKAAIRRLGKDFSLVTQETSLIVLDRVEDYVRYEITPPPELMNAYQQQRTAVSNRNRIATQNHIESVVQKWQAEQDWWNRTFPKTKRPVPKIGKPDLRAIQARQTEFPSVTEERIMAMAPMADIRMNGASSASNKKQMAPTSSRYKQERDSRNTQASIAVRPWRSDEPYMQRLQAAKVHDIYAIYLDERDSYANSPSFYLDVADQLLEKNQHQLGLRVLSNLAEMNLENRQVLRILAYRLQQAKQYDLAVMILRQVMDMAQEEPQSYRDLGLALEQAGQDQEAINMLYQVVGKPWNSRFRDIDVVALWELNSIIARSPQKLDISRIDSRLLKNMPLDLRVVLSWDTDLTDIDLWVTDPNDEAVYYGNRLSYQGGLVSPDCTQGYGPETYSLRQAIPGKYKVSIKFYGERQQLFTAGTTIQVKFITGFGNPQQKEELVTMRLKAAGDNIFVGEFTVK